MTLDTIRLAIQRAYDRLRPSAETRTASTISARPRDSGQPFSNAESRALDRHGFAEEALPWINAVYRFALRLTRRTDAAEDLVQETYLRAYRAWDSYTRGTGCRSWLFTICRNTFLHSRERSSTRREVLESDAEAELESLAMRPIFEAATETGSDLNALFTGALDDEVVAAIDRLPEEYREVLVLSDLADLTYPEIEYVLEIPRGTVKSRLFRGRRLLHDALLHYARAMGYQSRNVE